MPQVQDLSDQIRKAVTGSGQSLYRISRESKVGYASLWRFMHKQNGLGMGAMNKLCRYFRVKLHE